MEYYMAHFNILDDSCIVHRVTRAFIGIDDDEAIGLAKGYAKFKSNEEKEWELHKLYVTREIPSDGVEPISDTECLQQASFKKLEPSDDLKAYL